MNKGCNSTSRVGQRSDGTSTHHYERRLRDLPGFGRVYLAIARGSEVPAIVQAYTGRQQPLPAGLELLVSTGDEPRNLTVEVRRGAGGPLVEALEDAANLLGAATSRPEGAQHLRRRRRLPAHRRPATWLGWAGVGVSAALATGLALCLLSLAEASLAERQARAVRDLEPLKAVEDVPLPTEVASWANALESSGEREPLTIRKRYVIPDKPLKGQDTPPCASPARPVKGGCWVKLADKSPCPEGSAEHEGGCWIPMGAGQRIPVSIDRRRP